MSMTTLADEAPLDPDDELLVSYLDGELSREEESSLQNRLLEDEVLRRRLQQLQTGWDLLDELPDPAPSMKLVESTLELVVDDIVKLEKSDRNWAARMRWPLLAAFGCILGVAAAYGISTAVKQRQYRQQLRDLSIAENLDAYTRGKDLTLMRQLVASPDWTKMVAASRELGDLEVAETTKIASSRLAEREALVQELPIEKLRQLNLRWDRFTGLDDASRAAVRRTAEAVAQQADAEQLLQTMQTYAVWIQSLPTELRDEIESSDPSARRAAIATAIELTQISISKRSTMKLDDETIDWIYFALQQIIRQRVADGDEATIAHLERSRQRFAGGEDEKFLTIAMVVFSGLMRGPGGMVDGSGGGPASGMSGGPGSGPGGGGRRRATRFGGGDRPAPLSAEELNTIRLVLPTSAISILDLVAAGDPLLEAMTLRVWTSEAVRRKSPFQRRNDSTWLERYNSLPPREQDRIDLLPPKEIISELSRETPYP